MDLQEVVVANALEAQDDSPGYDWPGGTKVRRRSMTMAGSQVFEALGETPEAHNPHYPEMFDNWIRSSAVDLPTEGDLLADKPVPLRDWFRYTLLATMGLAILVLTVLAGVLYKPDKPTWRWLTWTAGSIVCWFLGSAAFYLMALAIEKMFATSQHVIFYIQGARKPGARLLATVSSLSLFLGLFWSVDSQVRTAVLRSLICAVIASAGLLLAQVITKVLAAHFHRHGFFERLRVALQDEYYLMAMSKPRGTAMRRKSWTEQMYHGLNKSKPNKNIQKLSETKLSLEDPKLLMSLEAVQRHVKNNRLKLVFDKCSEVRDEGAAKQLAFYIFWNVLEDKSRQYILRSDLQHFLPEKEVDGAFELLDADGDGKPQWNECRDAVIRVFHRRQQLTASLRDTGNIIGTLHTILIFIIQVASIFLYLLVWHVDIVRVWVTLSSVILAFTFVFGASIRRSYENVMFLFVVHPFDVGDRLLIDGESYVVYKMKLSTTIFEQGSGTKVWYPNDRLAMMPIFNQTRADCARESFEFAMDLTTPTETFEAVHQAAEQYCQEHAKDFVGKCSCVTTATLDPLKLRLAISVTYAFNGTETRRLSEVRHGLILVVTKSLVDRNVAYTEPQQIVPLMPLKGAKPRRTDSIESYDDDDDNNDEDNEFDGNDDSSMKLSRRNQ